MYSAFFCCSAGVPQRAALPAACSDALPHSGKLPCMQNAFCSSFLGGFYKAVTSCSALLPSLVDLFLRLACWPCLHQANLWFLPWPTASALLLLEQKDLAFCPTYLSELRWDAVCSAATPGLPSPTYRQGMHAAQSSALYSVHHHHTVFLLLQAENMDGRRMVTGRGSWKVKRSKPAGGWIARGGRTCTGTTGRLYLLPLLAGLPWRVGATVNMPLEHSLYGTGIAWASACLLHFSGAQAGGERQLHSRWVFTRRRGAMNASEHRACIRRRSSCSGAFIGICNFVAACGSI